MANPKSALNLPTNSNELQKSRKKGGVKSGEARRAKRDVALILKEKLAAIREDGRTGYEMFADTVVEGVEKGSQSYLELGLMLLGQMPAKVTKAETFTTVSGSIKHRLAPEITEMLSTLSTLKGDDKHD